MDVDDVAESSDTVSPDGNTFPFDQSKEGAVQKASVGEEEAVADGDVSKDSGNDGKVSSHWKREAVEKGTLKQAAEPDSNHVVISSHWPSFAFSLLSIGCKTVTVFCTSINTFDFLKELKLFDIHYLDPGDEKSESLAQLRNVLINKNGYTWIQGDSSFVNTTRVLLDSNLKKDKTVLLESNVSRKQSSAGGVKITHGEVGGVTNGKWLAKLPSKMVIDDVSLKQELHKRSVDRRLGHILKDTVKTGIAVGASSVDRRFLGKERTYSSQDRIPSGTHKVPVISKNVFKSSGYVKRWITSEELSDAYDVQVSLGDLLLMSKMGSTVLEQDVVKSAPGKVTHRLVEVLLTRHLDNESSDNHQSPQKGSRVKWLEYEDDNEKLNDERAARNDDLTADIDQWDQYVVRHYDAAAEWQLLKVLPDYKEWTLKPPNENPFKPDVPLKKPLICTGGEVTDDHRRLFKLLREALLRKQKYDFTKSFLGYCKKTYGLGWVYELEEYRAYLKRRTKGSMRKRKRGLGGHRKNMRELHKDVLAGVEAMRRYVNSEWWDWNQGSTLHFWRWHPDCMKAARDGFKVCTTGSFKPYLRSQQWPDIPMHKTKMQEKLLKVVNRRYMNFGDVVSLTGFFAVPKGESDIRLVYDATKCGFNDVIWAPSFLLPTIDDTLEQVDIGGWMGDIDLGEMFLNFPLDEKVRKYVGLDLTDMREVVENSFENLIPEHMKHSKRLFLRWTRCLMGLRCSPYNAVRHFAWAEEFIRGHPSEPGNPFGYDQVRLNLAGTPEYDPSKPIVQRSNSATGTLAANFVVYIDDIRICGASLRECVRAARRIASRCNYLGIQDAARKRRFPSQTPGVWSGAKSSSSEHGLYTSTTLAKWTKGRDLVEGWIKEIKDNKGMLDRKNLEKGRGFLVHLSRTYPVLVPYLKGIHNVLESWRKGRDEDGWKFSSKEWKELLTELGEYKKEGGDWENVKRDYLARTEGKAPAKVDSTAVKRLKCDLDTLKKYFNSSLPPKRLVRGKRVMTVHYGFGDASGSGFGSSWEVNDSIQYRYGTWGRDKDDSSSNYRELQNIVDSLEAMNKEDDLNGSEIFFFTDNSTAERAFYKGSSSSRILHDLVTRLRMLEMNCGIKLFLCHVSGTRMIEQGSDGLSRGNMEEGVMTGQKMLSFIPIHQSALERCASLLPWIRSWTSDATSALALESTDELEILSARDWYERGHDHVPDLMENEDGFSMVKYKKGNFVWAPPPAAALYCAQQLRQARLKRTNSTHIFICPRLMEPHWRKQIHKSADIVLEIPAGQSFWPIDMHEPLILALYFPFLSHRPWQLRRTPTLLAMEKRLQGMWKCSGESTGSVLFQLWKQARQLQSLPASLVFKMLRSIEAFDVPRS